VRQLAITIGVVFLAASINTPAQDTPTNSPASRPAASRSQADCTGFIASPAVSTDMYVLGGADDDTHSPVRQFPIGHSIFIANRKGETVTVGTQYSLVRIAGNLFETRRYAGQEWALHSVGKPYEDVGRATVTHVNPDGIVAEVNFACSPVAPGDLAIPFQPRPIPEYTLNPRLDVFAPVKESKKRQFIVATRNNFGFVGKDDIVYLNIGEAEGVKTGQRYRVIKLLPPHARGFLWTVHTPPETLGEAVVLSVQAKSSVAIIVDSYREISSGDAVEAE